MTHFDIFTLFPGMFAGVFDDSILKRARSAGIMSVNLHNIRDYATGRHKVTDDTPYGGGGGMVMKPEPIFRAVETVLAHEPGWELPPGEAGLAELEAFERLAGRPTPAGEDASSGGEQPRQHVPISGDIPVILLTPHGRTFNQKIAVELAAYPRLLMICGRYEGVDERVHRQLVTDEISIGDFVISGGELAAMLVVDAVTRLLPGALGYDMAPLEDSFATGLLEYPQYTRPAGFRGEEIPEILTSGDHARVARWRREQALRRTWERRPDLLRTAPLSDDDRAYLARLAAEAARGEERSSSEQSFTTDEADTP